MGEIQIYIRVYTKLKRLFYACDDVTIRLGRPAGKPPTPLQNHSANHSALFRESPKSQPSSTPNSALRPKRKRSRTRNHKHAHIKTVGPKKQELLRESVTLSTATTGIVTRTRDPKPRPNETKRDSEMKLIVKRRVQPRSDPTTGKRELSDSCSLKWGPPDRPSRVTDKVHPIPKQPTSHGGGINDRTNSFTPGPGNLRRNSLCN